MPTRFGATPEEWEHFDVTLGLTEDLLPVVSDPSFKISPNSTLKAIGKVPSMLNKSNEITGFSEWTKYAGQPDHVAQWQTNPAYGICVQTRYARAIDVDTEDAEIARKIYEYLEGWGLPCRARSNSPKFLLCFTQPGKLQKRVIKMASGIIEFLANGQQFIAAGTHTSGARYEWVGGLPEEIPPVSLTEFELMWKGLNDTFGIGAATGAAHHNEPRRSAAQTSDTTDPVFNHLESSGQVLSTGKEGEAFILCPFNAEHTTEDGGTGTVYYPAGSRGYEQGHFKCLHAHCDGRGDAEFLEGVKYGGMWFEPLPAEAVPEDTGTPNRFKLVRGSDYINRPLPTWLIKKILPQAELAVIYGSSTAGKTFAALDMAMSIARGVDWNGFKVSQGRIAFICAEDPGGFALRVRAYAEKHMIDLKTIDFFVIPTVPNLMEKKDVSLIFEALKAVGDRYAAIFVDTFVASTAGGDENSGQDVGRALRNCKLLHEATGALVVLVHHAGKDLTKGARGWSGLRAAADAEIEMTNDEGTRTLRITKQKNGEEGMAWGVALAPIVLGHDSDGDEINSCTLEYLPTVQRVKKTKPRGENQQAILNAFDELGGIKATVDEILTRAVEYIPRDPRKRDQRRAVLRRALATLGAEGVLRVSENAVEVLV